jgi:hypothetical protein
MKKKTTPITAEVRDTTDAVKKYTRDYSTKGEVFFPPRILDK